MAADKTSGTKKQPVKQPLNDGQERKSESKLSKLKIEFERTDEFNILSWLKAEKKRCESRFDCEG